MFRCWISRNATLSSATSHIHYGHASGTENCLRGRCSPWKRHDTVVRQKRFQHGNAENAAHILREGVVPLTDVTFGKLIEIAAERWPEKECLVSVHQNERLTFSEMIVRSDRLAAGLFQMGLRSGDCLAVWGLNDVEWAISFLAAARAGFILVAINPAYQTDELIYCLRKVDVRAVIAPDGYKTQNYPRMLIEAQRVCPTLEHIIIYSKDHVTGTRRFCDVETLASRPEVEGIAAMQDQTASHDGSNLQFTSGSTGSPKATFLSHKALVNNTIQAAERSQFTSDRRVCMNVPFFHAFGILKGLMTMVYSGLTLVLPSRSFNPVKSVEAMVREKCDVSYGTPTMWINLLDAHQRLQSPAITLSCGVTGGAPASPELFRRIRECFRFENIKTIYGLTETTGIIFQSLPGEAPALTETTVGHISDHVEAKVVSENGTVVPFGTPGELWIRGYCTMMRYWGDEENTRRTLTEDGWLKTGDQFVLRQDGYGQIVGRLKDMLIRGGENIFPKEIEDFLMTHPLVLEAQVIGAYDPVYGEEICACVRLRDGARLTKQELKDYCRGKIAHFKIPRYVEFVDEYPKTASGKVQKFKLREEMERKQAIPSAPAVRR